MLMDDPGPFPCMVCGEWREPFDATTVAHRLTTNGFQCNVTHCADRPACIAYATADGPWTGPPQPPTPGTDA